MKNEKVKMSSGNIFEDIGVSNPERSKLRSDVMFKLVQIIKEQKLTQKQVSKLLNISQPKVSCLLNGKLSMFSLDNLLVYLNAFDKDVSIITSPKITRKATTVLLDSHKSIVNPDLAEVSRCWRAFRSIHGTAHKNLRNRVQSINYTGHVYLGFTSIGGKISKNINTVIRQRT